MKKKKKAKKSVSVGDVVLIPVENYYVPAKVLYLSTYFKDLVLLGLYQCRHNVNAMPSDLPDGFAMLIYTSQQLILKGRWPAVGHEELRSVQKGLSRRIVAGDVWDEDQWLGTATENELAELPQMLVAGYIVVETKAATINV